MKTTRKTTREWLIESSLSQYHQVVKEAKLTPRQLKIAYLRFRRGLMNYQIACRIDFSPEIVRNELAKIYDKIGKII